MKKENLIATIVGFFSLFLSTWVYAGAPVWTFQPLTATHLEITTSQTATVQYFITNQSSRPHTLVMQGIKGVTQITTGPGICSNPIVLSGHESCTLTLEADGSQVSSGNTEGPVLCQQGSPLQCYRPSAADTLSFTVTVQNSFTVGGTVSGLNGTVILLNNGGDANSVSADGGFTFSTPVAEGSPYDVTVGTQPVGQTCNVTNGSGTMGNSNVTNVSVTCTTDSTTLSTSLTNLQLQTNGNARIITITNIGSSPAINLVVSPPVWPSGTTSDTTCGSTLNADDSCTITVTPGANATSDCNSGTGSEPTPGVLSVSASNVISPVTTDVLVLTYNCIFQQGYIFSINDNTSTSNSIDGATISLTTIDFNSAWSNNDNPTGASDLINGQQNTFFITNQQGPGTYAAIRCSSYSIDSSGNSPCITPTCYSQWYLPAICQMGTTGGSANCPGGIPNITTNLSALLGASGCGGPQCLNGTYWSSTEVSPTNAWLQIFGSPGNQTSNAKMNPAAVRCARAITH